MLNQLFCHNVQWVITVSALFFLRWEAKTPLPFSLRHFLSTISDKSEREKTWYQKGGIIEKSSRDERCEWLNGGSGRRGLRKQRLSVLHVFLMPEGTSGPLTASVFNIFQIMHLLYMQSVRKLSINQQKTPGSTFAALYQDDHHVQTWTYTSLTWHAPSYSTLTYVFAKGVLSHRLRVAPKSIYIHEASSFIWVWTRWDVHCPDWSEATAQVNISWLARSQTKLSSCRHKT